MSLVEYLETMRSIQDGLIAFLEDDSNSEENFQNLNCIFIDHQTRKNMHDLKSVLHLVSKFASNFHRGPNFFSKIERVIKLFKNEITDYYSNSDIFNIFKSNKRVLLFLLEEQILVFDKYIVKKILTNPRLLRYRYAQYFQSELKPFLNEKWLKDILPNDNNNSGFTFNFNFGGSTTPNNPLWIELSNELPKNFNEDRKTGENHNFICQLIQKDLVKEFIAYINQTNYSIRQVIQQSIYETNSLLNKKQFSDNNSNFNDQFFSLGVSLIEYAAFYGSIQIFKYLHLEGVELTPSLWIFAIHSQNVEIINILEDNKINPLMNSNSNEQYIPCLLESIKCHHNDLSNFFINNFLQNEMSQSNEILIQSLKSHNYAFMEENMIKKSIFKHLCSYDHYGIASILLADSSVDINDIFLGGIQN